MYECKKLVLTRILKKKRREQKRKEKKKHVDIGQMGRSFETVYNRMHNIQTRKELTNLLVPSIIKRNSCLFFFIIISFT